MCNIVDAKLKKQLEARLFARGDDIVKVIGLNLQAPVEWFTQSWDYAKKNSWLFNTAKQSEIEWLIGSSVFGLLLGLFLRIRSLPWVSRRAWSDTRGGHFSASTLATFCHDAPYVLAILALSVCLAVFTSNLKPVPVMSTAWGVMAETSQPPVGRQTAGEWMPAPLVRLSVRPQRSV